jgi:hypothetical protein
MQDTLASFQKTLQEAAAQSIVTALTKNLLFLTGKDSGLIAEALIQSLDQSTFDILTSLVVGYENQQLPQDLALSIVILIAEKLNITLKEEIMYTALSNVLCLINCECLRRQGTMTYSWSEDLFSSSPVNRGFTELTEKGKELAHQYLLETYQGTRIN